MAQKPLQIISGVATEVEANVTSAGAGDSGKLVALDASGKLDTSLIPPGFGGDTDSIVAFEALVAGDYTNVFDDGGVTKVRKADNSNDRPADGFVLSAVSAAANATVYSISELNSARSGLTRGARYWLGTAGGVVTSAPTGAGAIVQYLGVAKSATELRALNLSYMKRA